MTTRRVQIFMLVATITVASASIFPTKIPHWSNDERIVSGEEAQPKQFPHQVAMFLTEFGLGFGCGGSVISDRWVLTAAHCIFEGFPFFLYVGAHNVMKPWELGRRAYLPSKTIRHEKYNYTTLQHDIAVIQTLSPIQFSAWVSPIALPTGKLADELFENTIAIVSGWGKVKENGASTSPVLRTASVTVINNEECNALLDPIQIFDTIICGQGVGTKGGCNGDSGGPLITHIDGKTVQIGIVSFKSFSGCDAGHPNGYTRLTKYVSWVQKATGLKL